MKLILFIFFAFMSTASADTDFSGIWKDSQNQFYSIHQSDDSVVVAELRSQELEPSTFDRGSLLFTNNQLDLAINGSGFFVLEREDGSLSFTRKGHFFLAENGTIVNEQGEKLVTEKEMVLPDNLVELVIEDDGTINQRDLSHGLIELNRIKLALIAPEELLHDSDKRFIVRNEKAVTYFYPSEGQGGVVVQGALEMLDYISQEWTGYIGELIDNQASIKSLNGQNDDLFSRKIIFESESTANLKITGTLKQFYKNEEKKLRKVF